MGPWKGCIIGALKIMFFGMEECALLSTTTAAVLLLPLPQPGCFLLAGGDVSVWKVAALGGAVFISEFTGCRGWILIPVLSLLCLLPESP